MASRDIALFEGGPLDGKQDRITETRVRLTYSIHPGGSYVFVAVDPKYRNVKHYRWEPS